MKKEKKIYDIGLDLGTGSVGYALIGEDGILLKKGKRNLWGSRLYETGKTAEERRLYRGRRRVLNRKKQRVLWLQGFFAEEMEEIDPYFYLRIKESFLHVEDSKFTEPFNFFNDAEFDEIDYYDKYPTIYHLRKNLIVAKDKKDIRLVYLALSHIVKYRGNFLYENQNFNGKNININDTIRELIDKLKEKYEITIRFYEESIKILADIIMDAGKTRAEKRDLLVSTTEVADEKNKSFLKIIYSAILGYKVDYKKIFMIENENTYTFSLSDADAESKLDDILDGDSLVLYNLIFKIYSGFVLGEILSGDHVETISDVMINRYLKHKDDLAILKKMYKKYAPSSYEDFFSKSKKENKDMSYTNYIKNSGKFSQEDLCKVIRREFEGNEEAAQDPAYTYVMDEVIKYSFLPKLRIRDNGVIPYQMHSEELKMIIQSQSKYYPFLETQKDKILSLVEFRIPYYVGPLSDPLIENNKFSWRIKKTNQKVYPWNFEEVIDVDSSAEAFISRMRNKCTYLPEEDVIPKHSLLYAEYEVLSEINQITIDGKRISIDVKNQIIEELFKEFKTISKSRLLSWLQKKKIIRNIDSVKIEGFQKENSFASSLSAYNDFNRIIGRVDEANIKQIEKIILWITLFEDKKILRRKLNSEIIFLSDKQIEQITRLNYTGWARLSRKLLTGIMNVDDKGYKKNIMDYLRHENYFFMQLITNDRFTFKKKIDVEAKKIFKQLNSYDSVDLIPSSPSVKKSIWQSMKVVEELVKYMGNEPRKIFIEYTREDQEKKRTQSRYDKLQELYNNFIKNDDIHEILKELKGYAVNKEALKEKALYLYFIQNGKCLYSGEKLDLNALKSYQIDHIVPRSYIKDDSFDNLALVYASYNQRKGDSLLLDEEIRGKMKGTWEILYHKGFMSKKKYDNLMKSYFTPNELKGFIQRQIVETSQIIKHITNLFREKYAETDIYSIKAVLTSHLRTLNHLHKIREINDYHHAHDAFLAAQIGQYLVKVYPKNEDEFNSNSYLKYYGKENISLKGKFGVVIDRFKYTEIDKETGELYWDGEERLNYIRKALDYSDCYISRKTEIQKGAFYDQTLYSPTEKNTAKLIPLKKGLDPKKYGGYSWEQQSHYCVVKLIEKNKSKLKLIGIPIRIQELSKTNPLALNNYITEQFSEFIIMKDYIKKYQKILHKGNEYYIVSSNEMINAKQLIISREHHETIYRMNRKIKNNMFEKELDLAYIYLFNKIKNQYNNNIFQSIAKKLEKSENEFKLKTIEDKIGIMNEILKITRANSSNGNFKKYNIGTLKDRQGRISTLPSIEEVEFVDISVSGIFERRYKL